MIDNQNDQDGERFDPFAEDEDTLERGRSGFLGWLANAKGVAVLVIVGLVALSIGSIGLIASLL
ncbi:hypothetical protein [Lysinibacter sp. HNR]|uniref:hypothetical protein n=1 Tax=Lysinibacter sp. HNR TaxID=3031408 RepID=UPI002435E421|nr:hypothetical protein [Lysinibacter sp. HNR]WGD38322.1 hypothetical protein FrondiHNR_05265 [Lysinibacter sp. HNR]